MTKQLGSVLWLGCAVAALGGCYERSGGRSTQVSSSSCVGEKARDFTLKTLDGATFNLASFRGKKIVVLGVGNPYG